MSEQDETVGPVSRPGAYRPIVRALRRRRRFRLGVVQLLYVLAAFGLGMTLPTVEWGPSLEDERVATMLFAVGASMLTFTGLVFSLLFLVVQWGTSTFTPRLNLFRDDPLVWHSFGFFVGVLVFALTAGLRVPQSGDVSILVAVVTVVAVLASLVLFRQLQLKAFRSIQLAETLDDVVSRGLVVLDALFTTPLDVTARRPPLPAVEAEVRWSRRSGVLQQIDLPRLVRVVDAAGSLVVLRVAVGEVVTDGALVATVHHRTLDADVVLDCLGVGPERTFDQDPLLAMRVLVDIGLKALSPAINDPTTAVQVIDGVEILLRRIGSRELDVGYVVSQEGTLRVVVPLPTWDAYVELANDELALAAMPTPAVLRRLERCLASLAAEVPERRRDVVDERLRWVRRQLVDRRPVVPADRSAQPPI